MLIVPGLNGSGPGHWQHFWQKDIPASRLVTQDSWSNPTLAGWRKALEAAIEANPNSILVAHSLGSILVAGLAKLPIARKIGGAILVAPADISTTARMHRQPIDFGEMPRDRLPFPALTVASYNDPYLSFPDAANLAKAWGTPLVDLGHAGHINIESGFGRWEAGYLLPSLLQSTDKGHEIAEAPALRAMR